MIIKTGAMHELSFSARFRTQDLVVDQIEQTEHKTCLFC